jgi:hypothetical protein
MSHMQLCRLPRYEWKRMEPRLDPATFGSMDIGAIGAVAMSGLPVSGDVHRVAAEYGNRAAGNRAAAGIISTEATGDRQSSASLRRLGFVFVFLGGCILFLCGMGHCRLHGAEQYVSIAAF